MAASRVAVDPLGAATPAVRVEALPAAVTPAAAVEVDFPVEVVGATPEVAEAVLAPVVAEVLLEAAVAAITNPK